MLSPFLSIIFTFPQETSQERSALLFSSTHHLLSTASISRCKGQHMLSASHFETLSTGHCHYLQGHGLRGWVSTRKSLPPITPIRKMYSLQQNTTVENCALQLLSLMAFRKHSLASWEKTWWPCRIFSTNSRSQKWHQSAEGFGRPRL